MPDPTAEQVLRAVIIGWTADGINEETITLRLSRAGIDEDAQIRMCALHRMLLPCADDVRAVRTRAQCSLHDARAALIAVCGDKERAIQRILRTGLASGRA